MKAQGERRAALAMAESAQQGKGLGGYYALEQTEGLEILEVVPSREKSSDGKFRGVLRHYWVKEVSAKGRVKSENINYLEIGPCLAVEGKGTVQWLGNSKTEDFLYLADSDTLSFRGQSYTPISLELNHLQLTQKVLEAREATAAAELEE